MNRRGFLSSILALGAAPAIVRADSLMRIVPHDLVVLTDNFGWVSVNDYRGPLITGEFGRYESVNIYEHNLDSDYYDGIQWSREHVEAHKRLPSLIFNLLKPYR
jgi:hypothetical protein